MWKVMIAESVHEEGARILETAPDVELLLRPKISRKALLEEMGTVDAVVTRSGTAIDREFLESAPRLKVAARAGVGVDNIDLAEASRRGVVVINAPTGNTLAATEHTMALMLSMARRLPQACTGPRRTLPRRSCSATPPSATPPAIGWPRSASQSSCRQTPCTT